MPLWGLYLPCSERLRVGRCFYTPECLHSLQGVLRGLNPLLTNSRFCGIIYKTVYQRYTGKEGIHEKGILCTRKRE